MPLEEFNNLIIKGIKGSAEKQIKLFLWDNGFFKQAMKQTIK